MSEPDEWPRERYPERLRIHGTGRTMTWVGSEPQEPWQEIIGYEDGEDDAPDSAVPYIRADVVEQRIAAARAEERAEAYGDKSGLRIGGPDYWREALGGGRYMPKHVGGALEGGHPVTVAKAMKEVEGTLAADVIASLVHRGQIAWQWRDRMEKMVRAEELLKACVHEMQEHQLWNGDITEDAISVGKRARAFLAKQGVAC